MKRRRQPWGREHSPLKVREWIETEEDRAEVEAILKKEVLGSKIPLTDAENGSSLFPAE